MSTETPPSLEFGPRRLAVRIAVGLAPAAIAALVVWVGLGGFGRDFRVPLGFSGDALHYYSLGKATVEHGWWWWNPNLGVPLVYPMLIFAQNTNVDQALVWVTHWFTRDAALAVNVTWIGMVALAGVTAGWGFRRLGLSRIGSVTAAVLYALSPFVMYRNVTHFNLVPYLVPLAATTAVLLATGRRDLSWRWPGFAVLLAGNLLLGFNFIYYPFFGSLLIVMGLALGLARNRSRGFVEAGILCLSAIVIATILNLIPTQMAWQEYGRPQGVQHLPSETEGYGLKIRHLVSPSLNHWFAPFEAWQKKEERADFPLENENSYARLGVIGTLGFLGLLVALVVPVRAGGRDEDDVVRPAARLTAVALLVAVVGGFSSVFSLLVSSDIRAYNRIVAFIAFFALLAFGIGLDRLTRQWPRLRTAAWMLVLLVGIADQQPALHDFAIDGRIIEPEFHKLSAFVSSIEARLPAQAMVFQLPIRPFPVDGGSEKMGVYDHFRPYLASHQLRWSYPALSPEQIAWEQTIADLPPADLPARLAADGFSAVLINRWGYADQGESIARALRDAPRGATTLVENDDFIALALRPKSAN